MVTSLRSGDQRIVHEVVALWLLMAEEIKDPKISRKVITLFWKMRKVYSEEPVNAEYYSKLLHQFKGDIERKNCEGGYRKVLFLQDNAPAYRAGKTMDALKNLGFECIDHPPDLV